MLTPRRAVLVFICLAAALAACQPLTTVPITPPERLPTNTPFAFSSLYGQLAPTYTPTAPPEPTATQQPPALTGESIPLHLFCTQSGPLGELAAARAAAFEAAVQAHNAAGGIQGAQMTLQITDIGAAEDPAALAERALDAMPAPLVVLCDAASEAALAELLAQRRTPAIALGAMAERRGTLYAIEPSPSHALAYLLRTLQAGWGGFKPTGASALRLAVLSWPEAYAGRAVTEELAAFAEERNIELVLQAEYEPRLDLNVYDSLFAMRDEHANLVFVNADSFGLAQVLNALSHLGLRSRVVVAAPAAAYEPVLYTYLVDPTYAEGLYLVSAWDYTPQNWEQLHMAAALGLAEDAMARALEAGGPQALTPAALAQALQAAPFGPLDFAGGARWPAQLALWQVGAAPGQLTRVSQPAALPELP